MYHFLPPLNGLILHHKPAFNFECYAKCKICQRLFLSWISLSAEQMEAEKEEHKAEIERLQRMCHYHVYRPMMHFSFSCFLCAPCLFVPLCSILTRLVFVYLFIYLSICFFFYANIFSIHICLERHCALFFGVVQLSEHFLTNFSRICIHFPNILM